MRRTAMAVGVIVVFAGATLFPSVAAKAQCSFADFSSVSGLNLEGSAYQAGTRLRLTNDWDQRGAAWCTSKTFVGNGFSTTFQFQIPSYDGADGFTFAVQNSSSTALGAGGGGLGFSDIPNSLAVEFDTYTNENYCDPSNNEVGFVWGNTNHCTNGIGSPVDLSSLGTPINIHDGAVHTATVTYSPGSLVLVLDGQTVLSQAVTLDNYVTLSSGQAWLGFTGGTGGLGETADILSWLVTANPPNYTLGFADDFGRSAICLDTAYGNWQWSVLKGNGTGNVYMGAGTVMSGSGYMRVVAAAASGYGLNFIYYTTVHRATGSFTYRPDAVSSALYDLNTLDDRTSCGAPVQPPPID